MTLYGLDLDADRAPSSGIWVMVGCAALFIVGLLAGLGMMLLIGWIVS